MPDLSGRRPNQAGAFGCAIGAVRIRAEAMRRSPAKWVETRIQPVENGEQVISGSDGGKSNGLCSPFLLTFSHG